MPFDTIASGESRETFSRGMNDALHSVGRGFIDEAGMVLDVDSVSEIVDQISRIAYIFNCTRHELLGSFLLFRKYLHNSRIVGKLAQTQSELLYLFIMFMHMSMKYMNDAPYTNKSVAKIFKLDAARLLQNEIEIYCAIDWDLNFMDDDNEYIHLDHNLTD